VRRRYSPWLLLLLLATACAGVLVAVALLRASRNSPARLIQRLPANSSAIVYVDFAALRRAGFLKTFSPPAVAQDPEYRAFVAETGFDYSRDLDAALVAFTPTGRYFLVRGRFDWTLLRSHLQKQGGVCRNAFCRVGGSAPERNISYFPIDRNVMGLAVSPDAWAATQLQIRREQRLELPGEPVWAVFRGSSLAESGSLPSGSVAFARALAGAERVVLAAAPQDDGVEMIMRVTCATGDQAKELVARLREITATLRDLIHREGQTPNPRDLSGVLTNGSFDHDGPNVVGRWPLPRPFLDSLAGGGI
jgi:hypothetical protein